MLVIILLLTSMTALNIGSGLVLAKDLRQHPQECKAEPGNPVFQAIFCVFLYFFAAFGISDYAISTIVYTKTGWASIKKLPGTLNTQCLLPVFFTAVAYLLTTDTQLITLLPCMLAQMVGALLGPRLVHKLDERRLNQVLFLGLLLAGGFILANKLGLLQIGGQQLGLHGWRLAIAIPCFFGIGLLKAFGVGAFPPTMLLAFFLGLHPLVAYPLMMGASALSSPLAAGQFIRQGGYCRRLTLLASTFGLLGVGAAVLLVRNLNISLLQWVVAFVVLLAAADLFYSSWLLPYRQKTQPDHQCSKRSSR